MALLDVTIAAYMRTQIPSRSVDLDCMRVGSHTMLSINSSNSPNALSQWLKLLAYDSTIHSAEYCDQRVCMSLCISVCLFVCSHILRNAFSYFKKFLVHVNCGRGRSFSGDNVDEVMFSCNVAKYSYILFIMLCRVPQVAVTGAIGVPAPTRQTRQMPCQFFGWYGTQCILPYHFSGLVLIIFLSI